jgi:autotransporter strand-loop-strand O-heptosyltransferase
MKKLLLITPHLSTGGAPQFTLNRIELLKDTYDVYCVEYSFLSPHFVVQRNKIIDLLKDKFFALEHDKDNLFNIVNSINPDIISIEEFSETFIDNHLLEFLYKKDRSWKIFETTHSSYNNSNIKRYFPDKFIFVSEWSKKMYSHFGVESEVIEYPIDKKEKKVEESREKFLLDNDYVHILNVGLFTSGKNQGYAFEIARRFLNEKVIFHFVGNQAGNFEDYWGPILKDKPSNCILWGEREDVEDFIMASDVFLFSSILELNPLVIKEVMKYDIPIFMFNLETYCGVYNNNENITFLSGNVSEDVNNIKKLLGIKNEKQKDKFENAYVYYATEKYFDIVKKSVESVRQFSNLPIIVYLLNSDKEIDVENTITVNWKCDISESENMFINENDNFYINRSNSEIYNILIQRPLIVKDALEKYSNVVAYVDSDSIATKSVDNIFNMYDENLNYPYFVEGIYDYLIINGRGGASTKDDLTNTLEHSTCELFNVNQKVREKYRQTGYFVSGQNTTDFLNEWYQMCTHPEVLKNNEWYAPFNEETILNVLLWKKDIKDGLPYIYVNGSLDTIDKVNDIGFNGVDSHYGDWFKIPKKRENLLFYHGEKRIDVLDNMIKKLKGLYYKNIKIADAGYVINLPHRVDRRESVIKTLNDLEITGYEFVDGTVIEDPEYKKLGCTASYLEIFKNVLSSDLENIIVIEDDVKLMNGVDKNHLDNIFNEWNSTVKNYDVVALGVKLLPRSEIVVNGKTHGGFEEMLCSQSLFYHRHFIEHYVSQMENYMNPKHYLYKCTVDMFLNDCSCEEYRFLHSTNHKKFNFGITLPMVFTQTDSFSDNELFLQEYDNVMENSFWESLNKNGEKNNKLFEKIGSVDSQQTKEKYINVMEQTSMNHSENIRFNVNFVNQPFFEILGNSDKKYNVEFFDTNGKSTYTTVLGANMWSKLNRSYFENWKIKVTSDDGFEQTINYDAKGKRVYVAFDSAALGDTISWIPYMEEFRKKWDCELIVSTFWNHLFEKVYPNITFVKPGSTVHNLYAMYKLGWFYNDEMEPELPNTIPLQKAATNILGLEYKEIKPIIDYKVGDNPVGEKYVVISPYSTAGLKHWDFERWEKLSEWLVSLGYKVINISKDAVKSKFIDNIKNTSIENTINYIHHSEFMIGLSSGLSWLSWAVNKHVFMISNFTEPDHEFTTNCTRFINKSVCNGCWNNPKFKFDKGDWDWCPEHKNTERHFECHKSITVEYVIDGIKSFLGSDIKNIEQRKVRKNNIIFNVYETEQWSKNFWENRFEYWEKETFNFIDKHLNKDKTFIDIGSWIGPMSLYSSFNSKNCIAYEPDPIAYEEFNKSIELNGINNIFLEKKGVSTTNSIEIGALELGHSVTRVGVSENSFTVECDTISEILNKNNLDESKISMIKIDIEGHETELLKDEVLVNLNVPMYISFHPGLTDVENFFEEVKPFLIKKGYDINNYPHDELFFEIGFEPLNKPNVSKEIEVSIGEIVDKLSILRLKLLNITDKEKLKNVTKEYDYLYNIVFNDLKIESFDFDRMVDINKILWDVEDSIRDKEREKQFDSDFIEMARTVYITNDQRAEIKKEINTKYGSSFVEEKSYSDYN